MENTQIKKERWGLLVAEERERRRLSRASFAKLFGVSSQAIHQWESGNSMPNNKNLALLAELKGWSLERLLTYLETGTTTSIKGKKFDLRKAIAQFEGQPPRTIAKAIQELSKLLTDPKQTSKTEGKSVITLTRA